MSTSHAIAVLLGTRPEAIKLAPVILAMRSAGMPHTVIATGQHGSMVDEVLALFGIQADVNLGIMREAQTLDYLLARSVEGVGAVLDRTGPSAVVVQGDTTSMLGSVLAAFHRRVPVAHVEAGLRSGDLALPFPEEMNRRAATVMARWHFAPTATSAANLVADRAVGDIHVVGNTVVDAVHQILARERSVPAEIGRFLGTSPYLLATAHRRESWGNGIAAIAGALRDVLAVAPDHRLVFVTHPNPSARRPVDRALAGEARAMVVDALPYPAFLELLRGARLVVSDSGGVQEEGPALGVPVLVTRRVTERPEGVAAGAARVVGTDGHAIRDAVEALIRDPAAVDEMARAGRGVYGDGHAAERIVAILARDLLAVAGGAA